MLDLKDMPSKLIIRKSKKRAILIILLVFIVLILFSSENLYSVFKDGVPAEIEAGSISRLLNNDIKMVPIWIPGILLALTIINQLINLFNKKNIRNIERWDFI